jgi:hypothetical protein
MKMFRFIAINIVILMALFLFSKYISKLSGLDTKSSDGLLIFTISFGCSLYLTFGLINGRRQRGEIIIDSWNRNHEKALIGLSIVFLLTISSAILSLSKRFDLNDWNDWNDFINLYFYLWLFQFNLLLTLGRPQFAENGISHTLGLLKWSDIKSCCITTGEKPNLTVNYQTLWSFTNNGEWIIPTHNLTPENQEALLQLLKKKMPLCEIRGSSI